MRRSRPSSPSTAPSPALEEPLSNSPSPPAPPLPLTTHNGSSKRPTPSAAPQPLELGPRKRKKTTIFEIPTASTQKRTPPSRALRTKGNGQPLSNVPNIMYNLNRVNVKAPELEFLHRLLFNFAGAAHTRKSNIRSFSGFIFTSDKDRLRVRAKLMRAHLNVLRKLAKFLDIPVKRLDTTSPKHALTHHAPPRHHPIALDTEQRALLAEAMGMDDTEISEACRDVALDSTTVSTADSTTTPDSVNPDVSNHPTKKESTMTAGKPDLVRALLEFLEKPRVIEGRQSLAQRERELKRAKKEAERFRAKKAARKKAALRKAQLLKAKAAEDSDEDGDEDLETGGTTWIELAEQWKREKLSQTASQTTDDDGDAISTHAPQ